MRIVGGTYEERCAFPRHHETVGSGMRAAAALTSTGDDIQLTSARHPSEEQVVAVTAGTYGISGEWGDRTRPVSFSYFTPLNAPTVDGIGATITSDIDVEGDVVLAFGFIESGNVKVSGRRVVVDPQRPRNLTEDDLPDVTADEVVWTLNERETRQLGRDSDVAVAAQCLLTERGLAGVVTKRGPRGVLVTTKDFQQPVGACVTDSVFPIGSGDVYASALTWAWGVAGADLVEAAAVASNAAAHWCETRDYPVPLDVLQGKTTRKMVPTSPAKPVYLAGPFFNLQQRWTIDVINDALHPGVWSPSHEVGPGGLEVAMKDLEGLESCGSVLALLDDNDPGTVFEAGYATKMGIPVIIYATKLDEEGGKMLVGSGGVFFDDLTTAVYKAQWAAAFHAEGAAGA